MFSLLHRLNLLAKVLTKHLKIYIHAFACIRPQSLAELLISHSCEQKTSRTSGFLRSSQSKIQCVFALIIICLQLYISQLIRLLDIQRQALQRSRIQISEVIVYFLAGLVHRFVLLRHDTTPASSSGYSDSVEVITSLFELVLVGDFQQVWISLFFLVQIKTQTHISLQHPLHPWIDIFKNTFTYDVVLESFLSQLPQFTKQLFLPLVLLSLIFFRALRFARKIVEVEVRVVTGVFSCFIECSWVFCLAEIFVEVDGKVEIGGVNFTVHGSLEFLFGLRFMEFTMGQFDYFLLEVIQFPNVSDLGNRHFCFEHDASELLLAEQSHHCILQDVDLLEQQHHIQLPNHLLSRLMEKLHILPLTVYVESFQHPIDRLHQIVQDIILLEVSWAPLFRSIQGLSEVHLVGVLVVEVNHDQQQQKGSQETSDIGQSIDYLLVVSLNDQRLRPSEEVHEDVDISSVIEHIGIGPDLIDDRAKV